LLKPRDSHSHSGELRWDACARRATLRGLLPTIDIGFRMPVSKNWQ